MTFPELQRWQARLTALLESQDLEEAVQHALSFPTPAYRLCSLMRICRTVKDAEIAHTLLAQASELVAAIQQPQSQSHAWGKLCRAYGCLDFFPEAEVCACRVSDRSAQRAHLDWLRRRSLPDDQKPRRVKRPRSTPEPNSMEPTALQAIMAAQGEREMERAVWAMLMSTGVCVRVEDRTLFRAAMHHALRGLSSERGCLQGLESLCFHEGEPELARRFYDACLLAARRESDPERCADALIQLLRTAPRYENLAGLESLRDGTRTAIAAIPDRRRREHAYTALARRLHGLGWRGKRLRWQAQQSVDGRTDPLPMWGFPDRTSRS